MSHAHRLAGSLIVALLAGCGPAGAESEQVGQAETTAEAVARNSTEVAALLTFANRASRATLRSSCRLRDDSASAVVEAAPYSTLGELADVSGVGTATLQRLAYCGRTMGAVPSTLHAIFDQSKTGEDAVIVFTVAEAAETVAFADLATREELEAVEGIGPTTAGHITTARPVESIFHLFSVSGVGVARIAALKAAAAGWGAPPVPVTGPDGGDYSLNQQDAKAMTTQAVTTFIAENGERLWVNHGYWVFGGEEFTDEWSRSYFLSKMSAFLNDDAQNAVVEWIGTGFADAASMRSFIKELVARVFAANLDMYLERYAEYVLTASAD